MYNNKSFKLLILNDDEYFNLICLKTKRLNSDKNKQTVLLIPINLSEKNILISFYEMEI